jgi:hypothetical protein
MDFTTVPLVLWLLTSLSPPIKASDKQVSINIDIHRTLLKGDEKNKIKSSYHGPTH